MLEFVQAVWDKHGVLAVVLCALLVGLWRVGVWIRDKIATPVIDAHLDLVKTLKETQITQTESMSKCADTQQKIVEGQSHQLEMLQGLACLHGPNGFPRRD